MRKVKKLKKKKLPSISTLKKKAWKLFSEWIRRKDADNEGVVSCVTCSWRGPWKESQAGHFIDGRNNTVLFDERLVHVQDARCNVFLKGNKVAYTAFMMRKFGYTVTQIEEFNNLRHKTRQMKRCDYEALITDYTMKLEELNKKA